MKYFATSLLACLALRAAAVTPPPNDDFAQAQVLTLPAGQVTGTTAGATSEKGEPKSPDGDHDGDTVWYTFTPTENGVFALDANTNYSGGGEVSVTLYQGTALKKLKFVGENTYSQGITTRVVLSQPVLAGEKYYLVFDTFSFDHLRTGTFGFNYAFETAGMFAFIDAPLNLNNQNAWTYLEGSDSTIALTVGRLGGSTGVAEVNYSITSDPRLSGALTGTLHFDPGVTRQTITLGLANDNVTEGNVTLVAELLQPTVNAAISPRGVIDIRLQDDEGTAPNDLFANAQLITATPSATPVITPYPTGTATVEPGEIAGDVASIWYKVQPTAFGVLQLQSSSLVINVYTGDSLETLVGAETLATFSVQAWSGIVNAGQTYYVEVNNFQNTSGSLSYTLVTSPSIFAFDAPTIQDFGGLFFYHTATKKATADVIVGRTGDLTGTASVHYATTGTDDANADAGDTLGNKAEPNVDFVPVEGTLNFAAGQSSASFDVSILKHKKGVQKHINVVLDNPSNAGVSPGATTKIYLTDGAEPIFSEITGTYFGGLEPSAANGDSYIQVAFSKAEAYSAKVFLGGKTYTAKGTLALGVGVPVTAVPLKGSGADGLTLSLQQGPDLNGVIATIAGSSGTISSGEVFGGQKFSTKSPTASKGVYTAALLASNQAPAAFQAPGSLSVTIAPTGHCRVIGTLPDGTKYSAGGNLSIQLSHYPKTDDNTYRTVSFGVPLYHGGGLLDGSVTIVPIGYPVEPPPSGDGKISLRWVRPALGGVPAFAVDVGGNVSQLQLDGGQLFSGATLSLSCPNGGLTTAVGFTLEAKNRAVFPSGSMGDPEVKFNAATGLFSGSFTGTGGVKSTFQGAVLQNLTKGSGSALVAGQAVEVFILPPG